MPLLIRRDGQWLYKGDPITRKSTFCLLASILDRDEQGHYLLETPDERGRVYVEDVPFLVVGLQWRGLGKQQELIFLLNTDECVTAGRDHELRLAYNAPWPEPIVYLHVRNGKGSFPIEARVTRGIYYELVALTESTIVGGHEVLGVWSGGVFFLLGDPPLAFLDQP